MIGVHFVKVYLTYDKGNPDGYHPTKRGYSLHVQPVRLIKRETYTSEICLPMRGYRYFILEVLKKSIKAEIEAEKIAREIYPEIVARVCTDGNFTIIKEVK